MVQYMLCIRGFLHLWHQWMRLFLSSEWVMDCWGDSLLGSTSLLSFCHRRPDSSHGLVTFFQENEYLPHLGDPETGYNWAVEGSRTQQWHALMLGFNLLTFCYTTEPPFLCIAVHPIWDATSATSGGQESSFWTLEIFIKRGSTNWEKKLSVNINWQQTSNNKINNVFNPSFHIESFLLTWFDDITSHTPPLNMFMFTF